MNSVEGVFLHSWRLSQDPPAHWIDWVRACGGSVFHTHAGRLVDMPGGTTVYGQLVSPSGETVGLALGVQHGCRLAVRERHFHAPTLPALASTVDPSLALASFKSHLRTMGFAEATFGSYDASYLPPEGTMPRLEYVVQLPPSGDLTSQLGATHRRHVRRGDREGWTTRILTGAEAEIAIRDVQQSTADRAAVRQRGFAPALGTAWAGALVPSLPLPDHGLVVLGAYREDILLSSILLGWTGARAFYLVGGSTPEGYQCGAAVWLHSRAVRLLVDHHVQSYNLGGTPIDAALASSPAHGLYRFKTGFGATPEERRGVRWTLRAGHARLHALLRRLAH